MAKGSRGGKYADGGEKQVPIDKWGKFMEDPEIIRDKDGNIIGQVEDSRVYVTEPDIQPITKKAILQDVDDWRMDDGTYGDSDTKIYIAYNNGKFVDVDDLNGKAYKKSGIVGVSISTAGYESVWGWQLRQKWHFPRVADMERGWRVRPNKRVFRLQGHRGVLHANKNNIQ